MGRALVALRKVSAGLAAIMIIPAPIASLTVNAVLVLCGYKSFKALESDRNDDDTRWCVPPKKHTSDTACQDPV